MALDAGIFDPEQLVADRVHSLAAAAAAAEEEGLSATHHVTSEVPRRLRGDSRRIGQVLVNLLRNAVKFTEKGSVAVEVELESSSEHEAVLHFRVTDTGIGIPAAKRASVFDAFVQADGSTTRCYGGTGLGLAISANLAGLLEGRNWIESEVGRGSSFHSRPAWAGRRARGARDAGPPAGFQFFKSRAAGMPARPVACLAARTMASAMTSAASAPI